MTHPVYIYYHTHWDREWYLPFREYQHRLLKVVDEVLDTVEAGTLPCFTLDGQTVVLEDYLAFRPQNRSRIEALVGKDAMSIGPWYVMPDEFLVSGESLIRNLQRGMHIALAYGEKTFTGYIPDTFGHSADIPMVLRQFGIDTAMLWRGVRPENPLFFWSSPSGDQVLTYHLTEGYFQNIFHMGADFAEKNEAFERWQTRVGGLSSGDQPILFPIGADHLGIVPDAPELMAELAPQAKTITPDHFMPIAQQAVSKHVRTLNGELRDFNGAYLLPGVFSGRLYLKQWNRRLEWRLTRQLEQLLVWQRLLGMHPCYRTELDFLWQMLLLNHPHDSICGCSVDAVHRENEDRFAQIDQFSQAMLRESHHALGQHLQPEGQVLVLNLSDAPYTGVVEIQQDYPLSAPIAESLPHSQVVSEETILDESYLLTTTSLALSENKALRRKSLIWVSQVSPHGIQHFSTPQAPSDQATARETKLENQHFMVEMAPEGDLKITNRQNNRVYTGIHQLWRNLEQGDSYNAAPVPGTSPERAILTGAQIRMNGPLRAALQLSYLFPSIQLPVETLISLDAGSSCLQFETRFTNNTADHKIQAVFSTRHPITRVVAEGHFSPVSRDYDPDYRIVDHMPAPKQKELLVQSGPIQRFIGFEDQTLITEGLTEYEVEGNQLKLTLLRAFGMLSKDDTGVRGSHAGPPMSTPEGQYIGRPFVGQYVWIPGFDIETAFCQADWFYGAVYGFDRSHDPLNKQPSGERSFISWDNPAIQSTAMLPEEAAWVLRLLNPTSDPQNAKLTIPHTHGPIQRIDLKGQVLEKLSDTTVSLLPYQIQTFRIPIE